MSDKKGLRASFWFMTDMHTFIKIKGESIKEIKSNAKKISKENTYGMVCPVTILKGDKELRRVGKGCHVDKNGNVKLKNWIAEISNDEDIKRILKL